MPESVLRTTVERIAEHVCSHNLKRVDVILHGGEPLLAGPDYLDEAARLLRSKVESSRTTVNISIQTNGLLLNERFLEVFHEHDITVGISLDGDAATHDRHRRRGDGRGSHQDVMRAAQLLMEPAHRPLFSGLLGVVDLSADPIAYYEAMLATNPPAIDLLLPHGTWSVPPPGLDPDGTATPYAGWLIAVFNHSSRPSSSCVLAEPLVASRSDSPPSI
jgi:uncharacterized protein